MAHPLSIFEKNVYTLLVNGSQYNNKSRRKLNKVLNALSSKEICALVLFLWSSLQDQEKREVAKDIVSLGKDKAAIKKANKTRHDAQKKNAEKTQLQKEKRELKLKNLYDLTNELEEYTAHQHYINDKKYQVALYVDISTFLEKNTNFIADKMRLLTDTQKNMVRDSMHFKTIPPCGIYRFYNSAGMSYIGESHNVWNRIYHHLKRNTLSDSRGGLQHYIRQNGISDLKVEVLWYGKELRLEKIRKHFEAYFIHEYDATNPAKGWNKVQPEMHNFPLEESKTIVNARRKSI